MSDWQSLCHFFGIHSFFSPFAIWLQSSPLFPILVCPYLSATFDILDNPPQNFPQLAFSHSPNAASPFHLLALLAIPALELWLLPHFLQSSELWSPWSLICFSTHCNMAFIFYHCLIFSSISICPLDIHIAQGSVFYPLFCSSYIFFWVILFMSVSGLTTICMLMTSKSRTSAYVFFRKLQPCVSNLLLIFPPECSTETSGLTHPKQNYFLPMWTFSSFHIYSLFQLMVSPFTWLL